MFARSVASSLLLACCSLLLPGCPAQPRGMRFCLQNETSGQQLPNQTEASKVAARAAVQTAMGRDVTKTCLDMLQEMAREGNHFYVLEANDTAILESEACSENEKQLAEMIDWMHWEVALRSKNKHQPLFKYPVDVSQKWEQMKPEISEKLLWTPVNSLPNRDELCLTRTGQLRILAFRPEMAGTYAVREIRASSSDPLLNTVLASLYITFHHVDFVFDSLEYFELAPVRQKIPPLSPKVEKARMFTSEPNLRYQFRSSPDPPKVVPMEALDPASTANGALAKYRFPEKLFKNMTIQMMWSPPRELHEFNSWTPACGTKITRTRFMKCAIDLDIGKLIGRLTEFQHHHNLKSEYEGAQRNLDYTNGDGLAMLYLLHALTKRLRLQLLDEARETTSRRPLYSAGFRWTEMSTDRVTGTVQLHKLRIPCHYTLLHHLPNKTLKDEGRASLDVTKIENTGEREQAVRLCGLADPLELLRMMGQVLVAQLKRLVNMIRQRPVVPQRSVVSSGKTLYMKCPVDFLAFERPACNLPDREDNILWTLNGKTMRFFRADVERGPSQTDECALTIKNIQMNDAGEYVCYRTRIGSNSVEDKPAYRHYVEVVRPEFDPPPVEEVYFGMTVCILWNFFLVLLLSVVSMIRTILSLLGKERESPIQPEVWTSFFDDDPALDDRLEDVEDDDDDEDAEDEGDDLSLEDLDIGPLLLGSQREGDDESLSTEGEGEDESDGEGHAKAKVQDQAKSSNQVQHNRHRWSRAKTWVKRKRD